MKKKGLYGLSTVAVIVATLLAITQVSADQFAHPAFYQVWDRTDSLVADGVVSRTWFWAPQPSEPRIEPWKEATNGQRLVQYFDKSRMELNDPAADPNSPFFVTNGLLTVELISGQMQVGVSTFQDRYPANIPMSGDPGDDTTPTHAAFQGVSNTNRGDHPAADRRGQKNTATIDRVGTVGDDPSKANIPGTDNVFFEPTTHHNIPRAFWDFLNQTGKVRENGQIVERPLITPWFYASGFPISEAYWVKSLVRGQVIDVLIQAYERRVLTFTPTNAPGWQVEMGNIGQHYYNWRYKFQGLPGPGTGTPFYTPTPNGSPTIIPTAIPGTPGLSTPVSSPSATPHSSVTPVQSTATIVPLVTVTLTPSSVPATATTTPTPAVP